MNGRLNALQPFQHDFMLVAWLSRGVAFRGSQQMKSVNVDANWKSHIFKLQTASFANYKSNLSITNQIFEEAS
ncbi:MAG TPA: hypothetical protein VKZ53_06535 [Candidatus Angelobacter sp.]|nr:hypothetical protein [Candidatus Angelobacter sp.]